MNTTETIYLSKKGMKELKKDVSHLERDRQQTLHMIRDMDKVDGHEERFDRIEKLAQLESIESELADKKVYLASAQPFPRKRDALKVALGSVVDLVDTTGRMVRYTIVDSIEANPSDGRISAKSPLGQNLIGKTIEDTIKWGNGIRANQLQLVKIT